MNIKHILTFASMVLSLSTGVCAKTLTLSNEIGQTIFINSEQLAMFMDAYKGSSIPFVDNSLKPEPGSKESYELLANILNVGYRFQAITQASDMDTAKEIEILYSSCNRQYNKLFLESFGPKTSVGIQKEESARKRSYLDKYLCNYSWSIDGKKYSALPSEINPKLFRYLKDATIGAELKVPGISGTVKLLGKEPTHYPCRVCDVEVYHVIVPKDPKSGREKKLNPEYFTIMNMLHQIAAEQNISPEQQKFLEKNMVKTELKDMKLVNIYKYSLVSNTEQVYFPANSNVVADSDLLNRFVTCRNLSDIEDVKSIYNTSSPVLYASPRVIDGVIYMVVFRYKSSVEDEDYVKNVLINKHQVDNTALVKQINMELFEDNSFIYTDE